MKNIVIGGASGAVGTGLVRHCLSQGHRVVAVIRDEAKQEHLQAQLGADSRTLERLHFVFSVYEDEAGITHLQGQLESLGQVDIVIASLGGWYHGPPLAHLPLAEWHTVVNNSLTSHFHFAKALMPLLEKARGGVYVMINGGAAEFPAPHSGVISIMAAAQKMMGQVLHQEARAYGVQVFGVAAFALVQTDRTAGVPGLWLSAEDIAAYVLALAENPAPATNHYWHKLQSPEDLPTR
jgi:NAD(P)-dependent dehydrogenase (short-subunit alcohol dehydrogenase family)